MPRATVSLSAHETVELRRCALESAARALSMQPAKSAEETIEHVVKGAQRFMQFLIAGNGKR